MGSTIHEADLSISGGAGDYFAIVSNQLHADLGQLRMLELRMPASTYTFTAFSVRVGLAPFAFSGLTLDASGRPAAAWNPYSLPDERVVFEATGLTPAVSATARFYQNFPTNRKLVKGPFVIGVRFTVSAGTTGTLRYHLESQTYEG